MSTLEPEEADRQLSTKTASEYVTEVIDRYVPFRGAQYWIIFLVALGALIDGMEQFNAGYAAPLIQADWGLSNTSVGAITSITFAGTAIGSLAAGAAGDRYGRKVTYMYNLGLYTLGAIVCAFAPNIVVLLIGRAIVGLGLGGELNTGLTLLSELVPTKRRGAAAAIVNVACGGLGLFVAAALATLMLGPLSDLLGGPSMAWRWLLGIFAVPALLLFVYRFYLPETPRYLVVRGRRDEANLALSKLVANKLRPPKDMTITEYIPADALNETRRERVRLRDIMRGRMRRHTIVVCTISIVAFGAQVTLNAFLPTILVGRGMPVAQGLLFTMIINVGGLAGAILASVFGYFLRRRVVLTCGAIVVIVFSLAFTAVQGVVAVLVAGAVIQMGFILVNTTTWIYSPELYPTRVRAFGTGVAVTAGLAAAAIFPLFTGSLFDSVGANGVFYVVAALYVIVMVAIPFGPETKGKSLEELGALADAPR